MPLGRLGGLRPSWTRGWRARSMLFRSWRTSSLLLWLCVVSLRSCRRPIPGCGMTSSRTSPREVEAAEAPPPSPSLRRPPPPSWPCRPLQSSSTRWRSCGGRWESTGGRWSCSARRQPTSCTTSTAPPTTREEEATSMTSRAKRRTTLSMTHLRCRDPLRSTDSSRVPQHRPATWRLSSMASGSLCHQTRRDHHRWGTGLQGSAPCRPSSQKTVEISCKGYRRPPAPGDKVPRDSAFRLHGRWRPHRSLIRLSLQRLASSRQMSTSESWRKRRRRARLGGRNCRGKQI
mmetsp:Transcript_12266/g.34480  ORF Transcript_12266/g.34480 Transcript_12266/m.34480 type:complete len:288 (+) Transcript_12266:1778-2641(+)